MERRIIGCGNPLRHDDSVGRIVAGRLRLLTLPGTEVLEASGEAACLLELMRAAPRVVLIDAMRSGRPAGTLVRFEPRTGRFEPGSFAGTHDFGVSQAVALAEALGVWPQELIVYGIEGADFSMGEGLTPAVEAAARRLTDLLAERSCTANG